MPRRRLARTPQPPAIQAGRSAALASAILLASPAGADELERHRPGSGAVSVTLTQDAVYESGAGWQGVAKPSAWIFFSRRCNTAFRREVESRAKRTPIPPRRERPERNTVDAW